MNRGVVYSSKTIMPLTIDTSEAKRLELLQQVNTYLTTMTTLDAAHIPQHLARLDHVLGFDSASQGGVHARLSGTPDTRPTPTDASILQEVEAAAIPINYDLKALILSSSVQVVRDAVAVVEENRSRGVVYSPAGLFRSAVENQWKPNHGGISS